MYKVLLIISVLLFGCSVDKDIDSNKEQESKNSKTKLADDLEVFCKTGTEELQAIDGFQNIVLSHSVDGKEAEIIISGTVKNKNDGMILYGIVSTFFSHSGIPQEKIKIIWSTEIESKSSERERLSIQ